MRGLSLVAASGGHSSSRCASLSLLRPLLLRSTGSRRAGSVIVAHGPSRSAACGIFPDQGSNPCPLHWQADSQPLRHQGSPTDYFIQNNNMRKNVCFYSTWRKRFKCLEMDWVSCHRGLNEAFIWLELRRGFKVTSSNKPTNAWHWCYLNRNSFMHVE